MQIYKPTTQNEMLFNLLKSGKEGGPAPYIHTIAIPLIAAGIAIVAAPSYWDLLLHLLDKSLGTKLEFAQSPIIGVFLILLGLLVYIVERIIGAYGGQPLLALRHQSFLPIPPSLSNVDLPRRISMKRVRPIDCDLYPVMSGTTKNLEAALSIQADWAQKAVGAITGAPDAPVAYYGIVHIPFQFLAGCRFSTYRKIELFELERGTNRWRELSSRRIGNALSVKVDRHMQAGESGDVSIRISVSYLVHLREVEKILKPPFDDIHLHITEPRIDAVRSCEDLTGIASIFRREIDSDQVRGKRLHIFYSGPVSLGFSLGQQIRPSIHGEVRVYNYDASACPPYEWSVSMSNNPKEANVRFH